MIVRIARWMTLIGLIVWLTACGGSRLDFDRAEVGVIYTDALKADSELVLFASDGKTVGSRVLNEQGIFQIVRGNGGEWILPVRFDHDWIHVSRRGEVTDEHTLEFPIQVMTGPRIQLASYNTELNAGTLEIREGKKIHRVRLRGFLRVLDADDRFVYAFADVIDAKLSLLYVLNRATGMKEREIVLETGQADDILLTGNRIFLTSVAGDRRIAVVDKETWNVRYITLPFENPQYLFQEGERILVTHAGPEGRITVLDAATLRVKETAKLPQPVFKARYASGKLYVLSQSHDGNVAGEIGIYRTRDWKREKLWRLPRIRNTLVQDLEVVR
jgi:hypothetical protein